MVEYSESQELAGGENWVSFLMIHCLGAQGVLLQESLLIVARPHFHRPPVSVCVYGPEDIKRTHAAGREREREKEKERRKESERRKERKRKKKWVERKREKRDLHTGTPETHPAAGRRPGREPSERRAFAAHFGLHLAVLAAVLLLFLEFLFRLPILTKGADTFGLFRAKDGTRPMKEKVNASTYLDLDFFG